MFKLVEKYAYFAQTPTNPYKSVITSSTAENRFLLCSLSSSRVDLKATYLQLQAR